MKKQRITVLVLFVFVMLLVLTGVGMILLKNSKFNFNFRLPGKKTPDLVEFPKNPVKGQPGYVETQTSTSVNDEGRYNGTYSNILKNQLVYINNGEELSIGLNDEITLQCTSENLAGIDTINLRSVTAVKLVNRDTLKTSLKPGEPIFLIAKQADNQTTVYSVFVNSDICKSQ